MTKRVSRSSQESYYYHHCCANTLQRCSSEVCSGNERKIPRCHSASHFLVNEQLTGLFGLLIDQSTFQNFFSSRSEYYPRIMNPIKFYQQLGESDRLKFQLSLSLSLSLSLPLSLSLFLSRFTMIPIELLNWCINRRDNNDDTVQMRPKIVS